MDCGIAIWNFAEPSIPLPKLIEEFADMGFDVISFLPRQLQDLDGPARTALVETLKRRELGATVHGKATMTFEQANDMVKLLGPQLRGISIDAAMASNSRGSFYDTPKMAALMQHIARITSGTSVRFGIEDFPLDAAAVEHYRSDLGSLLATPRFGLLIDIGHLHLRRSRGGYFDISTADFFTELPLSVFEVHLHDNDGARDSHLPLGEGEIDFKAMVQGLRSIEFDGVATIEIAPTFHSRTPQEDRPGAERSLAQWYMLWSQG